MNPQKPFCSVVFLITSFIILLAFSAWFWVYATPKQDQYQIPLENINIATSTDEIAGWETYKNEEYGFEIKYPSDMNIVERSIDDSNYHVTFDSKSKYINVIISTLNKPFSINMGENGFISDSQDEMTVSDSETDKALFSISPNVFMNEWHGFTLFDQNRASVPKDIVFIPHKDFVYAVYSGDENFPDQGKEENEDDYERRFSSFASQVYLFNDRVLSTFKFTN
jgi:hypothetical protein